MFRPVVHLLLHFVIPGIIARWAFAERWTSAWLTMVLTMIVDIDHLLAETVYDPNRCGIGFHPLHSYPAIFVYLAAAVAKTRLVGLGLLIHMALDGFDCFWLALE